MGSSLAETGVVKIVDSNMFHFLSLFGWGIVTDSPEKVSKRKAQLERNIIIIMMMQDESKKYLITTISKIAALTKVLLTIVVARNRKMPMMLQRGSTYVL